MSHSKTLETRRKKGKVKKTLAREAKIAEKLKKQGATPAKATAKTA